MENLLEILYNVWYGPDIEGLIKAEPVTAGLIMGGASLLGSVFGGIGAGKRARRAAAEKARLTRKLDALENSRQPIINPYEGVEDLSSMITNPYENLSVATQAAEIQAEEADISLANTLDLLAATGASAGGATALAQAALKSKRDISADIERQETNNEKLRAQGEQKEQLQRMAEAQRIQQANVLGREFVYGQKERRETEKMNRVQSQITGAAQQQANYESQAASMFGGAMSTLGSVGMTMINK
jgi:uncharacterized protein YhaN